MFFPAGLFFTMPFPPGRPPVLAPLLARILAAFILPPLVDFILFPPLISVHILNQPKDSHNYEDDYQDTENPAERHKTYAIPTHHPIPPEAKGS
jgi:hypothetical protein